MDNCKELGVSDVFFQVRGEATAFYNSSYEPWAWELTSDSSASLGKDPGWDPLQAAIEEANRRNLRIHAWCNVFPGWRGIQLVPKGVKQKWRTNRSWFMIDHRGRLMRPSKSFYAFMSPGIVDVRKHIANVFRDIASKYPNLTGIHMDYVRYPAHKELGTFRDFSYDKESVKNFRLKYKKAPRYDSEDWMEFKRDQVTESIRMFRKAIRSASETMMLTATHVAEIHKATSETGQDPQRWLDEDLVDWVFPMAYKHSVKEFRDALEELNQSVNPAYKTKMVIGVTAAFPHMSMDVLIQQMKYAYDHEYLGTAIFAYSALFTNHKENVRAKRIQAYWQEDRLRDLFRGQSSLPELSQ